MLIDYMWALMLTDNAHRALYVNIIMLTDNPIRSMTSDKFQLK